MQQQVIQTRAQQEIQQQIDNVQQQNEQIEQENDNPQQIQEMEEQNEQNNEQTDVVSDQFLLQQLEKLKFQVQEICSIQPDNALELLRYYKWNIKKLMEEYFKNPIHIRSELQNSGDYNNHDSVSYPEDHDKPEPCQNCQNESPLIQLGCKHKICQNCLQQFIIQKIQQGEKKIPCLIENCVYKLPISMISSLIPKPVVDDLLVQEFVSSFDELSMCKNEKCQKILKRPNNTFFIVNCTCNQKLCFKCKLENHAPVSCEIANNWLFFENKNLKILNSQFHYELFIQECQKFLFYQYKQNQIQNKYKSFKDNEIVGIERMQENFQSEIETIQNTFEEILLILLFQKWIICFEYYQKKMKFQNNSQQILIKIRKILKILNETQVELENLLNFFLIEIKSQNLQDNFYELSNKLGKTRVLSKFQRKWFEYYINKFI